MVNLVYCPPIWWPPGKLMDVFMREACSSYDEPICTTEVTFPFSTIIHNTNAKLPHHLLSIGIVVAYLSIQISHHHNQIISVAVWNSVLQVVVGFILLLIHCIICWCVRLYHRHFSVLWVVSCCNHFADRRWFHQGSLCPPTLHDGHFSPLYLIIFRYTTFTSLCGVTDPVPFHLVSLIPNTWNPYSFISLATCPARVVSGMVLTFQQSMIVCRLGATMVPISLWASGWLWPKSVIAVPAATPPGSVV